MRQSRRLDPQLLCSGVQDSGSSVEPPTLPLDPMQPAIMAHFSRDLAALGLEPSRRMSSLVLNPPKELLGRKPGEMRIDLSQNGRLSSPGWAWLGSSWLFAFKMPSETICGALFPQKNNPGGWGERSFQYANRMANTAPH